MRTINSETALGTLGLSPLRPFVEVTKPRLVLLTLWTVAVGFVLASRSAVDFPLLLKTLIGAGLTAAGSMALNQYLERESDAQMRRTENRPLPSGRMKPREALIFGISLALAGLLTVALSVNFLSAYLSAATLVIYLFVYTPLKKRTPLCTLVGAIPGAIPPMLGWAAARGELGFEPWVLFSILFAWQLPHFFAIAWICREDYSRAGFRMLSVVDPTGKRVGQEIMIYSLAVHLLSFVPAVSGMTGPLYYLAALLLGIWFLVSSFQTAFQLDLRSRSFFRRSVLYLAFLLLFLILDRKTI